MIRSTHSRREAKGKGGRAGPSESNFPDSQVARRGKSVNFEFVAAGKSDERGSFSNGGGRGEE